jgi:hypothetical protein
VPGYVKAALAEVEAEQKTSKKAKDKASKSSKKK